MAWGAAATALTGAATSVGTFGLGFIGMKRREQRQDERQRGLMDLQTQNQMKLNEHGREQSMNMWRDTNYKAQMDEMKKAGLSAGLMYGGSGAGGATSNAGSGGGAQGGQPAQIPHEKVQAIDIAQMALLGAQKENIQADTKLKLADADKKDMEGQGTFLANSLEQWLRSDRSEHGIGEGKSIDSVRHQRYGQGTIHQNSLRKSVSESEAVTADKTWQNIDAKTKESAMRAIESEVNAELGRSKTKLTDEQTRKIFHDILVNYINAGMKGLDTIVKGRLGSIGNAARNANKKGM